MLQHAFKEWAAVCESLAQGRQAIILRKGGIAEDFAIEHRQFWLYPTYLHQKADDLNEETRPLLGASEAKRPPAGMLRLQYWAEVSAVFRIRDLLPALLLSHLHCWSEEAVRKRFEYRTPGLNVLAVRVYRVPRVHKLVELPEYDGCRSWVQLAAPLSVEESSPVLDEESFRIVEKQLDMLLNPTALA